MTGRAEVPRWRSLLELVTTLAVLITAIVLLGSHLGWWSGNTRADRGVLATAASIPIEGAASLGNRAARVGIVMFSDFECPFCIHFSQNTLPLIRKDYVDSGLALLAYRHNPLEAIHLNARWAAEAAVCAHAQGQFWRMHDALVDAGRDLGSVTATSLGTALGLDMRRFDSCTREAAPRVIGADSALSRSLGVTGTPVFFVGPVKAGVLRATKRIEGARTIEVFREVLDGVLRDHEPRRTGGSPE